MKKGTVCFAAAYLFLSVGVSFAQGDADTILYNGKVLTVDARFSVVEAVAVRGDQIVAVGTSGDVLKLAGPDTGEPTMERSPEVFLVRSRMHETGVDFCLDVHGDEALPYIFLAGMMGIPSLSERQKELQAAFDRALLAASPEFQTEHGYPASPPGKGNLTMCANYVAETFGCLSLTLEMPFKDNADRPEPEFGWSPER